MDSRDISDAICEWLAERNPELNCLSCIYNTYIIELGRHKFDLEIHNNVLYIYKNIYSVIAKIDLHNPDSLLKVETAIMGTK